MRGRIPELDGLRALAIIAVFVGHALQLRMMWVGVDLFLILSGFLITGILLDAPRQGFRAYLGSFYERRARRILPPFLLLLVFVSLVFGVDWAHRWYLYFGLTNYVPFFWHDPPIMALSPLWSLAVEEQFYLFWPLAVFFLGVRRLPFLLLGILLLTPMLRAAATPWLAHQSFDQYHWVIYRGAPFRCDCLAMGALLTFVWRKRSAQIRRFGYLGLIPAACTPPFMLFLSHHTQGFSTYGTSVAANVWIYEISLFAMTGLVLWALGGRYTAILRFGVMRGLARISYSFYLIHEGMLQLFGEHLHNAVATAVLAGAASLVYAELSWHLLERPLVQGGSGARRELAAARSPLNQETEPSY